MLSGAVSESEYESVLERLQIYRLSKRFRKKSRINLIYWIMDSSTHHRRITSVDVSRLICSIGRVLN